MPQVNYFSLEKLLFFKTYIIFFIQNIKMWNNENSTVKNNKKQNRNFNYNPFHHKTLPEEYVCNESLYKTLKA